ncbi:MAG: hypothetical protein LBE56_01410 [Tannerella sp.]|nr:hypothetical protein [Tannerella sp.]
MKNVILLIITILAAGCQPAQEKSLEAVISNEFITAKLDLPDAEHGYYRGSRFDWTGVMPELKYEGHEYFGVWFKHYDPHLHDAICGPVEEFMALGYDEAPVGGEFLRIGIGGLRKPSEEAFSRFGYYELVNPGKWTVKKEPNSVLFTHVLKDAAGYSYEYQKEVVLTEGKAQLVLKHTLKNTGTKAIKTQAYNHNFFTIDCQPVGPGVMVKFPFPLDTAIRHPALNVTGQLMEYIAVPEGAVQFVDFKGLGNRVEDYDFSIENKNTRAGVRITGDKPVVKIVYWSSELTQCPEPYIDIIAAPGETFSWTTTYDFYVF